jgi:BASS family bile acid:Na+ symporter
MFSRKDLLLLAVTFMSMAAGVLAPGICAPLQPYPVVCMMLLLFLSFLSVRFGQICDSVRRSCWRVSWFLAFRLLLLPVAVSLAFRWVWPDYSLAVLLLSGMSTGAVASFFSLLLQANTGFVLVMTVASSLLVPFTLPPLVELLFGHTMEIPVAGMIRLLALVVFVPVAVSEALKWMYPAAARYIMAKQYPFSLILFAATNLGIFSKYSDFFFQQPATLLSAAAVAFILGGIHLVAGVAVAWRWEVADQLAAIISLWVMNKILVIVFSSQFFSPLEPTVAAVYTIPFYALVVPVRAYRSWALKR